MRSAFIDAARAMSLRTRLVIMMLTLLLFALTVAGIATVATLKTQLLHQVDNDLRSVSKELSERPGELLGKSGARNSFPTPYDLRFHTFDGHLVWKATSRRMGQRAPLVEELPFEPFTAGEDTEVSTVQGWTGTVPDTIRPSERWRVLAVHAERQSERGYLLVSTPLGPVDRTVAEMQSKLVLMSLTVLIACALAALIGLRRAFSPLREIEQVTTSFARGDFSRRVAPRPESTEVGRLGSAVNSMLEEINTTFKMRDKSERKMRQFVADASHELRTPLVSVRGFAELYRAGAVREEADVARAFSRIEDEATRMSGLVEDLLQLARLDEQRPLHIQRIDLTEVVLDVVQDADTLEPDRAITLVGLPGQSVGPVHIPGDDARLRQVFTNLLANARKHTPAGSPIEVAVGRTDEVAVVQVIDHGEGLSEEDAQRVFERFYRTDSSRQRGAGGGSGLGLAITAAIVAAHEGHVEVHDTPSGGATFVVMLPLSDGLDDDLGADLGALDAAARGGTLTAGSGSRRAVGRVRRLLGQRGDSGPGADKAAGTQNSWRDAPAVSADDTQRDDATKGQNR